MDSSLIQNIFLLLLAALIGGFSARLLKLPLILGFIAAGIFGSFVFPSNFKNIHLFTEIGLILLLFSVGLELSLSKLAQTGYVAVLGAIIQIFTITFILFFILNFFLRPAEAIILASAFSLSSTALVVKMLEQRAQTDAIHGRIMIGWLLTQDLAVIPMIALLPLLAVSGGEWLTIASKSIIISTFLISAVFFLGRMVAPFLVHSIASTNSRELISLVGVTLALGTAFLVSLFGISAALGAFLAGVVISETHENHAIFAETRPLRDLFVILFFVTLGFFVTPEILFSKFLIIIVLASFIIALKFVTIFFLMALLGYRGKTAWHVSLGLSQISEFSFIIFLAARRLDILSPEISTIGITTTLLSLILTPFLFKSIVPLWRKFGRRIVQKQERIPSQSEYKNHIIICGFGRMGRWIGQALDSAHIPFVVIDYSQKVVHQARMKGIPVIFGDPAEQFVLQKAGLTDAKAIIVAIPDLTTQEEVISHCQTQVPRLPIFARAHLDKDVSTLSSLKVKKVIQPEFEAALSVVKEIFRSSGKSSVEIKKRLSRLRQSRTLRI